VSSGGDCARANARWVAISARTSGADGETRVIVPAATRGRYRRGISEHAPQNALTRPDEIERFHDRCSELMRALLEELARTPDRPRTFPQVEDALGWPRRRIASVLGGVWRLRQYEFGGRRPYRFHDERQAASGRWEIWMDARQARAVSGCAGRR
jgi:hypothetical protein